MSFLRPGHFLRTLAALLAVAGLVPSQEKEASRQAPRRTARDVLLIVLDDLGWPELQKAPTPQLDAFALRGTTYRRFYATPLCTPTRYALLFGRHAFRSGVGTALKTHRKAEITGPPLEDTSLAELLGESGFATGAFGKWHLSNKTEGVLAESAQRHGFGVWRAGVIGNLRDYFDWERVDDGKVTQDTTYNTTAIADASIEWWQATPSPKFGYVAFQAAHHPVQAPPADLLAPVDVDAPRALYGGPPVPSDRRRRRLPIEFRDLIRSLDHELGRLLAAVDLRETLVWIISDNGPTSNLSLAHPSAKGSMGEAGIHVPAWCAGPGVARGRVSDHLVQAIDLFAAITKSAGLALPSGVAEDSMVPGLRKEAFVHLFAPNGMGERTRDERAAILADPAFKLVRDKRGELFYDLDADPWERRPVSARNVDANVRHRLQRVISRPEAER